MLSVGVDAYQTFLTPILKADGYIIMSHGLLVVPPSTEIPPLFKVPDRVHLLVALGGHTVSRYLDNIADRIASDPIERLKLFRNDTPDSEDLMMFKKGYVYYEPGSVIFNQTLSMDLKTEQAAYSNPLPMHIFGYSNDYPMCGTGGGASAAGSGGASAAGSGGASAAASGGASAAGSGGASAAVVSRALGTGKNADSTILTAIQNELQADRENQSVIFVSSFVNSVLEVQRSAGVSPDKHVFIVITACADMRKESMLTRSVSEKVIDMLSAIEQQQKLRLESAGFNLFGSSHTIYVKSREVAGASQMVRNIKYIIGRDTGVYYANVPDEIYGGLKPDEAAAVYSDLQTTEQKPVGSLLGNETIVNAAADSLMDILAEDYKKSGRKASCTIMGGARKTRRTRKSSRQTRRFKPRRHGTRRGTHHR